MSSPGDIDVAALVTDGTADAVTKACLSLEVDAIAAQRSAIVATCIPIITHGWWGNTGYTAAQYESALVAMLAAATASEFRRSRRPHIHGDLNAVLHILERRDEAFRRTWVDLAMDDVNRNGLRIARRLVHDGSTAKPTSDAYTIALVSEPLAFDLTVPLDATGLPHHESVLDVLRANPDLLVEDVWRVFEVEGGGEHSLAAHDKYTSDELSWRTALVTLAADGTIDRQRLLDASLDALQRGFAPFRAQWFSAFHEALMPTIEEKSVRASTYLALAASPVGPTVSMAVKALALVQKAGSLDPHEVVATIGPALLTPAKGTAKRAVALLAKAGDVCNTDEAALVLVDALGHPAKEVQASALEHLRRWSPMGPTSAVADRLAFLADGCHVSVRATLDGWSGGAEVSDSAPTSSPTLPPPLREIDLTAVEWLAPNRSLAVITDRDALYERASAAMEDPGDPDEIEVVLEALARFDVSTVAEDRRARTLAKRAAKLQTNADRPVQSHLASCIVARFAPDAWTEPQSRRAPSTDGRVVLDELLERRLDVLARAFRHRGVVGLLSTPTHRGGWIDPLSLIERLLAWPSAEPPDETDLTAALLRTAPDADRIGRALSHAGTSPRVPESVRTMLAGWPQWCRADDHRATGWTVTTTSSKIGERTYWHHQLHVVGADDVLTPAGAPLTVRLKSSRWGSLSDRYCNDRVGLWWTGSLLPGMPGRWACAGADAIGATYDSGDVQHGDVGLFEAFFDADVPLGGDAHLLVALGTNDRRPAVHSLAVDLAVASVADGRLDHVRFGQEIGRLASTGVVAPGRWGTTLRSVADAGAAHHVFVRLAFEDAMATARPRRPQDILGLLELFETLLLEDGVTVTRPEARVALASLAATSRTSKTASAAARILAHT